MENLSFENRSVIVTGPGRRIGREDALLLANRGALVAGPHLGPPGHGSGVGGDDPAASVVEEISAAGGAAVAVQEDVSTEAGTQRIVDAALDAFGHLDAVINNAGIIHVKSFEELSREEFQRQLDVHYLGSLAL